MKRNKQNRKLINIAFCNAVRSEFKTDLYKMLGKFNISESQFENWSRHINRVDPSLNSLHELATFINFKGNLCMHI